VRTRTTRTTPGLTLRGRRAARAVAGCALLALAVAGPAQADPGDFDAGFAGTGLVFADIGLGDEHANAMLRAPDGSLIVAGDDATDEMFVARYTPAGSIDPSFGPDHGIVRITFPGHSRGSSAAALAFGPGGSIVVGGSATASGGNAAFASEDVAVARLTSAGALDETFSDDGRLTFSFPGQGANGAQTGGVAAQSDGAIVVGATVDDGARERMAALRFTAAGAPDTTFSEDGSALLDFAAASSDGAAGIAIQGDGKLVLAGESDGRLAMARLTTAGVPDTGYATDGTALIDADSAAGLLLQPDDKAVVAGNQSVTRVRTNGTLDPSFGTVAVSTGGDDGLSALARGPSGTIVAAGQDSGAPGKATVARLTANGALDKSFSGDGLLAADLGTGPRMSAVVVDGAGAITVAGTTDMGATGADVALARFTAAGAPDTTFGSGGSRTSNFGYGGQDRATSVRAVAAGRVLVALESGATRYLANGALDTSYGTEGILSTPVSGGSAITSAGGLVVAGRSGGGMELRRYTPAGAPDTTFGTAGAAPLALPGDAGDLGTLQSVLVAADGKIIVVGGVDDRAFVARYLSTGARDATFSSDGYAEARPIPGGSFLSVAGAALQDDGRPLLVAYANGSGARVARFTRAGQLDATFGTGGVADAGEAVPGAITVDGAGRIVVAGSVTAPDHLDSAVTRLTPRGARDRTFSGDGIASVDLGANDYLEAVTVDGGDRILAAGTRGGELDGSETFAGGPRPTVARFRVDGEPDDSFAATGSTVLATGRRAAAAGVALDAGGNVLAVGVATSSDRFGGASDAFVARLLGGGTAGGDSSAPQTMLTAAPPATTDDATATFSFSATGGPVTFECRVDDADFSPCTSPHATAALANGAHAFDVRAIDLSGNVDRTPARATFTVTDPVLEPAPSPAPGDGDAGGGDAGGGDAGAGAPPPPSRGGPGWNAPAGGSATAAQIKARLAHQLVPRRAGLERLRRTGAQTQSFTGLVPGRLDVEWRAKRGGRSVVIARGFAVYAGTGSKSLRIRLTPKGRALLRAPHGRLRVIARGTFTPAGAAPVRAQKTFVLKP
jgi:uncharacterized delta-60 repeat protein